MLSTSVVDGRLVGIDNCELEFVRSRLVEDGRLSEEESVECVREFRKFLGLVAREISPLAMIGKKIDEVWHEFVLFTPQYSEFCERVFGRYIHHQPNSSMTPVPKEAIRNFVNGYTHVYGQIPEIWYENMEVDMKAFLIGKSDVVPRRWSGWTG